MNASPIFYVRWFVYRYAVLLIILCFCGCLKVGPDYIQPKTSAPTGWHSLAQEKRVTADETPVKTLSRWWITLNDPLLSQLMERAVAGNLDVKKARAKIREARAKRGVAQAGYFPTLDGTASGSRSRSSEAMGAAVTSDLYAVGFDAAWELDLFGGVRRSVEAAEATLQSSQENWRDVLVSLQAEVALNYIDVRTYQARLSLAEATLTSQSETCELTAWRYQAGLSDELALQQARYNRDSTRSQIPALRKGLEGAMNRVAVLLGEQPGKMHDLLKKQQPIPVTPLTVAVGIPADVLRRRPDLRKAERDLAVQTANVGVAVADLYPKFKLTGSIGLEALSHHTLFSSGNRTYSFGPSVTWPLFAGGAIRQNIELQSALQEQALIAYETAVLDALEEVENALTAYAEEQKRRESLYDAVEAAKQAAALAMIKYEGGLADFNTVLETQRSYLSYQDQLTQSEGTVTANLIRLYKTLGGGWTPLGVDDGKK